eukprot:6188846-Pleurochrysis_carterae.AAC.2
MPTRAPRPRRLSPAPPSSACHAARRVSPRRPRASPRRPRAAPPRPPPAPPPPRAAQPRAP